MSGNVFTTEAQLFQCKLETVAGTAVALANEDGNIRVRNINWGDDSPELDDESAKYKTGDHTHDEAIVGKQEVPVSGDMRLTAGEFHYDNTGNDVLTDTRFPFEKLLNAGGLVTTITEPTNELTSDGKIVAVPQKSGDIQTLTAALYEIQSGTVPEGIKGLMAGAMCTWTISADGVGKPFMFNFELVGKIDGVTKVENVNIPVFDDDGALSTVGFNLLNTTITVEEMNQDGSDAGNTPIEFCVDTVTLDPQNTLGTKNCQSDPTGIAYKNVSTRDPRFTIKPQLKTVTDFDYYAGMINMSIYKVIVTHTSAHNGAALIIETPRAQLISSPRSDADGIVVQDMTFRPLRNVQGATDAEKENDYRIEMGAVNVIAPV